MLNLMSHSGTQDLKMGSALLMVFFDVNGGTHSSI